MSNKNESGYTLQQCRIALFQHIAKDWSSLIKDASGNLVMSQTLIACF